MAPNSKSKGEDVFKDLTETEIRLLALVPIFCKGIQSVPYPEIAKWTGLKVSSAATLCRGAKRKVARNMESFSNNPTISPIKAGSAPKRAKKTTAKSATGEAKVEAKIEAEIEAEVEAKDVEYGAIPVKKEPNDNLNFEDYMLHFMKTDPKASKSAVQAVGDAYDVDTPVIKEE